MNKYLSSVRDWLPTFYNIAMIVSVIFIILQLMLSRKAVEQTNNWEKAKVTMTLVADLEKEFEHSMFKETLKTNPNDSAVFLKFDPKEMNAIVEQIHNSFPEEQRDSARKEMSRMG